MHALATDVLYHVQLAYPVLAVPFVCCYSLAARHSREAFMGAFMTGNILEVFVICGSNLGPSNQQQFGLHTR